MHDPVAKKTEKFVASSETVKDVKPVKKATANGQPKQKNDTFNKPKPNPQEIIKKTEPKEKDNDQTGRVAKEEPKNVVKQSLKQYSDLPEPSFKQTKSNDVFTKPVC